MVVPLDLEPSEFVGIGVVAEAVNHGVLEKKVKGLVGNKRELVEDDRLGVPEVLRR